MGCDCHCYAEVKNTHTGEWDKVGVEFPNPYYRPDDETKRMKDGYVWNAKHIDQPIKTRNYDLFSILANVRNGQGFAGCDTGDGFTPIAMPRGLPEDVSQLVKEQSDEWGCDGHSHSWLTLGELMEFDWKGKHTKKRGWCNEKEFRHFVEHGRPDGWCGGVSGGSIRHVSNQEMEDIITKRDDEGDDAVMTKPENVYTLVEWGVTYAEAVGEKLLADLLDSLLDLVDRDNQRLCEVRIVFWFDN